MHVRVICYFYKFHNFMFIDVIHIPVTVLVLFHVSIKDISTD